MNVGSRQQNLGFGNLVVKLPRSQRSVEAFRQAEARAQEMAKQAGYERVFTSSTLKGAVYSFYDGNVSRDANLALASQFRKELGAKAVVTKDNQKEINVFNRMTNSCHKDLERE